MNNIYGKCAKCGRNLTIGHICTIDKSFYDSTKDKSIESLIIDLEEYTKRYEISFQFWGEGNNNVYISKDDVELQSFGGEDTIKDIIVRTIEYLDRINNKIKQKKQ